MGSHRVFVVWANPLFRDSVRMLLQHPDVDYVGEAHNDGLATETILALEADTILVEEALGKVPAKVMDLFAQSQFAGRLVSVSLRNNRLHVYHREEWAAAHADDLLHLILQS
jgi:DNA-binding NarL/FixJ family response regulator